MTPLKQQFIDNMKGEAIEQQIKYGIPASVTMAQAVYESKYGTSRQVEDGTNNLFGIKKGSSWTGPVKLYDDDKRDEPFRCYSSFHESFEDHSRLLTSSKYMAFCKNLSPTNYRGWVNGICDAGYATKGGYGNDILREINDYNLAALDQEAMRIAAQRGVKCGYMRGQAGKNTQDNVLSQSNIDNRTHLPYLSGHFAMPIDFNAPGVQVTGKYMEKRPGHMHGGLDIGTGGKSVPLVATEDNGIVKDKGTDNSRGNYITIEYTRSDNSKVRCTYMHLAKPSALNVDDKVNAGKTIGNTGNSGRSTGVHLHFEVEKAEPDGTYKKNHGSRIDPTKYLAELQLRSGQDITLKEKNGKGDYLASAKASMTVDPIRGELAQKTNSDDPKKWLQLLMQQNNDMDHSKDLITGLMTHYATSMLIYMVKLKQDEDAIKALEEQEKNEQKQKSEDKTVYRQALEVVDAKALHNMASSNYEDEINKSENQSLQQEQTRGRV